MRPVYSQEHCERTGDHELYRHESQRLAGL